MFKKLKVFRNWDDYETPFSFTLSRKKKRGGESGRSYAGGYSTVVGGMCTVILSILLLGYLIFLIIDMYAFNNDKFET